MFEERHVLYAQSQKICHVDYKARFVALKNMLGGRADSQYSQWRFLARYGDQQKGLQSLGFGPPVQGKIARIAVTHEWRILLQHALYPLLIGRHARAQFERIFAETYRSLRYK